MISAKTKILLLTVSSTSFFYDQIVIPFGLVSLGSYVASEDYIIKGIEMNSPPEKTLDRYLNIDKELLEEIKDFSPDIVAMSTYATNMYNAIFWAEVIKENLPNSFILLGGNHVSYIAEECIKKCSSIDIIVQFEGEIPFKMICEKIKANDYDFSNIPGITYRAGNKIRHNPTPDLINLNDLPNINLGYFEDTNNTKEQIYHADMISARGCPFHCTFCNCNHYWKKKYRVKNVEQVIKEIQELKSKYPNLESIRFRDDSLTTDKKRCVLLCDKIIRNYINLNFEAHSRLDGLDEEVIKSLSKAGFRRLYIGLESGSQAVLQRLKKGIDISKAKMIIQLLRKYGISFRISFMTSTPGERYIETIKTFWLIEQMKLEKNEFYIGFGVTIYPGTAECEKFLDLNPNYEWISKTAKFKGKYYGIKDLKRNILYPVYSEYGILLKIIIRIIDRKHFIDRLKDRTRSLLQNIFVR